MQNIPASNELKVLKVLARTAKAIRRGEDQDLVIPAAKWEAELNKRVAELEDGQGQGAEHRHQEAA